jgi:hypothetical protein
MKGPRLAPITMRIDQAQINVFSFAEPLGRDAKSSHDALAPWPTLIACELGAKRTPRPDCTAHRSNKSSALTPTNVLLPSVIPAQAGIHLCSIHDGFPLSRE